MISLSHLFEETEGNSVPKKYKKRIAKKSEHFDGFEESLPTFNFPQENTPQFEEDLDEVRRCVRNSSLSEKFLKKSHQKSEDIFKKLLKKEDFDWSHLNKILDEFDGVITRLKFKYNRSRPYVFFKERGEDIETSECDSPSFPSGHAAFAYFICDYLSNELPHRKRDLENVAQLISQSRIENGVHFPSDVSAGRFVGEQAAKFVMERKKLQENINLKNSQKTFVRFLRRRSRELRPTFDKKEALNFYAHDMSVFITETLHTDIRESYLASKNFLSGYSLEECSDNKDIKRLFEGMRQVFFRPHLDISDMIFLNKILENNSSIRKTEKMTLSGISHSPVKKIKEYSSKIDKFNKKPFLKLAALSWIAPFERGNEKITNIIFLKETGFNFDITNQILCDDLPYLLEKFYFENNLEKLLS